MDYTAFAASIVEKEVAFFLDIYDEVIRHIEKQSKIRVEGAKTYCVMLENLGKTVNDLCSAAEKYEAHGRKIEQIGRLRLTAQTCGCMAPSIAQLRANILAIDNGLTRSLDDVMNALRGQSDNEEK